MSEVTSPNRIFVRRLYRNLEKEPYKMHFFDNISNMVSKEVK